jgi:methylamine dehydrogenase accessory protein MauD
MDLGVWVSRLAVATVFGLAAWGKLVDRAATRRAVGDFGVPTRWVPIVGRAVPVVEVGIAVAVLPPWSAVWAATTALVLLAVFTVAVGRLLARGQRPTCSCFGAASATAISGGTLVRNGSIAVVVCVALVGSLARSHVPAGLPVDDVIGLTALAVVAAVLVWLGGALRTLRRQLDQGLSRTLGPEGLPVGAVAPEFDLPDTAGRRSTLAGVIAAGRPVMLVFLHPDCAPCETLAQELPRWRERKASVFGLIVISTGGIEANTAWARAHHVGEILVQQSGEVTSRYRVRGTPSAVLVDTDGRIATPTARGPMAIRDLLAAAPPRRRDIAADPGISLDR